MVDEFLNFSSDYKRLFPIYFTQWNDLHCDRCMHLSLSEIFLFWYMFDDMNKEWWIKLAIIVMSHKALHAL